jgi:hypothetical protein
MGPASDLLALDPKATHMAPSLCEAGSVAHWTGDLRYDLRGG